VVPAFNPVVLRYVSARLRIKGRSGRSVLTALRGGTARPPRPGFFKDRRGDAARVIHSAWLRRSRKSPAKATLAPGKARDVRYDRPSIPRMPLPLRVYHYNIVQAITLLVSALVFIPGFFIIRVRSLADSLTAFGKKRRETQTAAAPVAVRRLGDWR